MNECSARTAHPPATFDDVRACLVEPDPGSKRAAVAALWARVNRVGLDREAAVAPPGPIAPGRPARPELVDPRDVPKRGLGSDAGRAALVHAIAHIEFNAINLALDAAWRFRDMPGDFFVDWLSVAADEARHYRMLERRLEALGHDYGDFPAHDGLWAMAERTSGSCLERMALVPRVLEARGLDVTPGMIERLRMAGDDLTIDILEVILDEEVRHVQIGSRWFSWCCERHGVDPESTFLELLRTRFSGRLRGPFNVPARMRAGFSERELEALERA